MRNSISKTIVAGLAALAMAAAVVLPTTPASAGWSGGSSWHGGGVWYNGWWGPAVAAGIAAGALATYPYWGGGYYGYGYPNNGCWAYRPTYDGYGRYLGQNWVNVC